MIKFLDAHSWSARLGRVESSSLPRKRVGAVTWLGLFIALFGMVIVRAAVYEFYPPYSFPAAIWRESLNWLCGLALILIIRFGERLNLRSVGIGTSAMLKSIAWGAIIAVICFLLGGLLIAITHYNGGSSGAALGKLPLWLVTLIVLRAGVLGRILLSRLRH